MISFEPLWKTMKKKGVTTYTLVNKYKMSKATIDRLKHNRNMTLQTIEDLCHILGCRIEEVVDIT